MFAKKEKEEQPKIVPVSARDVGFPYTELTIKVSYVLTNGKEYNYWKTIYLSDYISHPTAKEAMKAFYDNYLDIQNEYREQIVKNFGKYEGYIRFDNLFIRSDQCTKIYIECSNNSNAVRGENEDIPDDTGWPWEVGSYNAE